MPIFSRSLLGWAGLAGVRNLGRRHVIAVNINNITRTPTRGHNPTHCVDNIILAWYKFLSFLSLCRYLQYTLGGYLQCCKKNYAPRVDVSHPSPDSVFTARHIPGAWLMTASATLLASLGSYQVSPEQRGIHRRSWPPTACKSVSWWFISLYVQDNQMGKIGKLAVTKQ